MVTSLTAKNSSGFTAQQLRLMAVSHQMTGDFTICTVSFGNGVIIPGLIIALLCCEVVAFCLAAITLVLVLESNVLISTTAGPLVFAQLPGLPKRIEEMTNSMLFVDVTVEHKMWLP